MIQQKIVGLLETSTTIEVGLLFQLVFFFFIITIITSVFSIFQRISSRRKEIQNYTKLLKIELDNKRVATQKGFEQCKKKYDEWYHAHLDNSNIYLTKTEDSILRNFLNTYSTEYEVHVFKRSEFNFALKSISVVFKVILKILLVFLMAYSNIILSPDRSGIDAAILFSIIATIMLYCRRKFVRMF